MIIKSGVVKIDGEGIMIRDFHFDNEETFYTGQIEALRWAKIRIEEALARAILEYD
jgi:hypothetical protein